MLQQEQEGQLRVISYGSRTLSQAERNYCTTRRELLAVVYGLKQYRQFLLGREFLLRVDHSALTFLRRTPDIIGQSARWLDLIEEFDFDIIHRSGVAHGNCDALSRRPCEKQPGECQQCKFRFGQPETISAVNAVRRRPIIEDQDIVDLNVLQLDVLRSAQAADDVIMWCMQQLNKSHDDGAPDVISPVDNEARILWQQLETLHCQRQHSVPSFCEFKW